MTTVLYFFFPNMSGTEEAPDFPAGPTLTERPRPLVFTERPRPLVFDDRPSS